MFTGLIEEVGTIEALSPAPGGGARLSLRCGFPEADLFEGASVAVDGACLTVVERTRAGFRADASPETLRRTTLGERRPGDRVNLERPMALGERLGGHLVLGHVDGVGRLTARTALGDFVRFQVKLPPGLAPLVVEKGSLALDGISLTVNELLPGDEVALLLIPESLRQTTWGERQPGAGVNIEADVLGKHVARLLQAWLPGVAAGAAAGGAPRVEVDLELLRRAGFPGA